MNSSRAILLSGAVATVLSGCARHEPAKEPDPAAASAAIADLQVSDEVVGTGAEATTGANVEVHYDGWLYDPAKADGHGTKFDSSRDQGRPFRFRIGAGRVIAGWDQGVAGMKVGGRRQLVIPAALGYGDRGAGGGVIPPGATLVFDIELLRLE